MKFRYIDPSDMVSVIVVIVIMAIGIYVFTTTTSTLRNDVNNTQNISSEVLDTFINITQLGDTYFSLFPTLMIFLVGALGLSFLLKIRSGRYHADFDSVGSLGTEDDESEDDEPEPPLSQLFDNKPEKIKPEQQKIEPSRFKPDENKKKYNWGKG